MSSSYPVSVSVYVDLVNITRDEVEDIIEPLARVVGIPTPIPERDRLGLLTLIDMGGHIRFTINADQYVPEDFLATLKLVADRLSAYAANAECFEITCLEQNHTSKIWCGAPADVEQAKKELAWAEAQASLIEGGFTSKEISQAQTALGLPSEQTSDSVKRPKP